MDFKRILSSLAAGREQTEAGALVMWDRKGTGQAGEAAFTPTFRALFPSQEQRCRPEPPTPSCVG